MSTRGNRWRGGWAGVVRCAHSVRSAIAAVVGPDEIQFWLGLVLVACGFWSFWRPGSYLVPGLALIWSSLPSRAPFVARTESGRAGREEPRKRVT